MWLCEIEKPLLVVYLKYIKKQIKATIVVDPKDKMTAIMTKNKQFIS